MADNKMIGAGAGSALHTSKGVARGHILCCCAVVFVCFMLTCLNLYMLSSTRSVLRHLDSRIDNHPRNLQRVQQEPEDVAAALMLQQQMQRQMQQPDGADDFILLAPSDLDNAWTTQTGRLLVPVGQPEEDDNGWKQMQVQLAEQTSAQQRHIENLHDKLADQYRVREELQRDQHNLMKEHQEVSRQHQRQMAKKDRQLLKEKHRALKKGSKQHDEDLRRVKSEVQELKKVVEAVQSLDPLQQQPTEASSEPAFFILADNETSIVRESSPAQTVDTTDLTTEKAVNIEMAVAMADPTERQGDAVVNNPLEHIFSAVFGPSPGAYFFPSYSIAAERDDAERTSANTPSVRIRRDLDSNLKGRRAERLARLKETLGRRQRRHEKRETGPMMRVDGGELVPLYDTPAVVLQEEDVHGARRRRLAAHRGLGRG